MSARMPAVRPSHLPARQTLSRVRSLLRCEQGQSLIEFAVTLPALMLLLTGMFVFGIALNNYLQLTEATNTGTRQVAISRGQTNDPCGVVSGIVYSAAPLLTQSSITFAFNINGTSYNGANCSSSGPNSGAAGNLVAGKPITVTVTYPCNLAVFRTNYAPSCSLVAKTTEVIQ